MRPFDKITGQGCRGMKVSPFSPLILYTTTSMCSPLLCAQAIGSVAYKVYKKTQIVSLKCLSCERIAVLCDVEQYLYYSNQHLFVIK